MPQQVIEHDENLSDKEVFPGSMHQQQMVSKISYLFFGFCLSVHVSTI
jgi:hypothetical protein